MEGRQHISRDAPSPPRDHHKPPLSPSPSSPQSGCSSTFDTKDAKERIDTAQASEISLDTAFEQLNLADKTPMRMFSAIGAFFEQVTTQDASLNLEIDDWRTQLERADIMSEDGQKDVGALTLIRSMLDQLWSHGNEDALLHITTLLADGSREGESKIEPDGDPCIYCIG